jgi:DNA-cytosine methyltransferase
MIKFFSLFTGAGGVDCAARGLGLDLVGGLEKETYPVNLYRQNFGPDIIHRDILDTDPEGLPDFDFLWASPSCRNFSRAQRNPCETLEDVAIAQKVAAIIKTKQPTYFALENVPQYAINRNDTLKFTASFKSITDALWDCGYTWDYYIANAHDFGSPQDRRRLILRATKSTMFSAFISTHGFGKPFSFNSWSDRMLTSDITEFTENQKHVLSTLDLELNYPLTNFIVQRTGYGQNGPICRMARESLWTLRASHSCDGRGGFRSSATYYNHKTDLTYRLNDTDLASLMGFPRDYKWGTSKGLNSYAACNAVPVELASAVIRSMIGG